MPRKSTEPGLAPGTRWRRRRPRAGVTDEDCGVWTIISWHGARTLKYAILRQHPLDDIAVFEGTLLRCYEQVR